MRFNTATIAPFPCEIDRDQFGHWTSGFCDGEAAFMLCWNQWNSQKPTLYGIARLVVGIRADDLDILLKMQSYWKCGTIQRECRAKLGRNPIAKLSINCIADLSQIIVPHFDRYPLRSKKRRDFEIWKLGVDLAYRVNLMRYRRNSNGELKSWNDELRQEFQQHIDALRGIRVFRSPTSGDALLHSD